MLDFMRAVKMDPRPFASKQIETSLELNSSRKLVLCPEERGRHLKMAIRQQCSDLKGPRQISPLLSGYRVNTVSLVNQQELSSVCGDFNRPMIFCRLVQCPGDHLTWWEADHREQWSR